jgi:hypothetical protein
MILLIARLIAAVQESERPLLSSFCLCGLRGVSYDGVDRQN